MRASASKTGLLAHCAWWAGPEARWDDVPGPRAERGTRFHQAIARYVDTGEREQVGEDIAAEYEHAVAWVISYGRQFLRPEVAFAWDHVTDRAEELRAAAMGERDYSSGAGRLCGTADLVSIRTGIPAAFVADWKTGDGSGAGPQLRTLAVMVARAWGLQSVTVCALEVTAAGVVEVARETLDAFELDAHAGELAEHIAAVPTAEPKPGPHCGELYCPARTTCPAGEAAVAELVPADALVRHRFSSEITGPDHAVWMLDRIRLVESACKSIKDRIKAVVPDEGWRLEDGATLKETTRQMPRFDKHKAMALLRQLGATQKQIEALTYVYEESAGLRVVGGSAPKRARKGKAA